MLTLKIQLEALQSQSSSGKKPQFKKKEGENAFVWDQGPSTRPKFQNRPTYSSPYPYYPNSHPVHHTTVDHPRPWPNYTNISVPPFQNFQPNFQTRSRLPFNPRLVQSNNQTYNYPQTNETQNQNQYRTFTNLSRPLDQLYEQLKATGKIGVVPPKTYPRGIHAGYDSEAICAYHSESSSHSTDKCWALKHKIQEMIDAGD